MLIFYLERKKNMVLEFVCMNVSKFICADPMTFTQCRLIRIFSINL